MSTSSVQCVLRLAIKSGGNTFTYASSYCFDTTARQGHGLLKSHTAFCLVAVMLTEANLG